MTTRDDAIQSILNCNDVLQESINQGKPISFSVTSIIVDKLIAYGIHPNAIRNAFRETKTDVGTTNKTE